MLKDDIKRELQYKLRQKIAERQPEEKSFGGFLSNITEDVTTFGKGFLALGKKAITHPIKTTKTVGGIAGKILPFVPTAAKELMAGIGETFIHPIKRTEQIKTEFDKIRAISYDEQKQFIEESLSQAAGIENKEKRLATQIGLGLIGDVMQEISHPAEFLYEKPFTFGLDIMAAGGGKIVGKGTRLTAPLLKQTKLATNLEQIFIPSAKLKQAGFGKVAEDLANTSEKIFNMQESIIKTTAEKFEKVFNLSKNERFEFFDVIDKLRRETTKAVSENPKIQKAIDWWLDSEVPKLSKVAGLPAEKQIRNYLHHFFPERLSQAEKTTKPFKIRQGYLKLSKDVAGFSKDPIVSISAIKIKVALDAIKNSFLTRTANKYAKSWNALKEEFKGIVGADEFSRLEKGHNLSQAIQKRMNIEAFSPKKGVQHWFPKEIAEELNKMYGKSTTLDTIRTLLSPLDFFNRNWKPLATATRPRYHTRNVIGNLYNAIVIGKMNPARLGTAAVQQVTGYLNEVRKGAGVSGAIAKKLFPEKLQSKYIDLATKNNIVGRGFFAIDLHDMSKAIQSSDDIIKAIKRVRSPAEIYKIPVLRQYLNLSRSIGTAIEDNARLAMFVDFLKKAKSTSPTTIAKAKVHVNKHLFDYLAGLGEGDRFIKKFIPFWAWTRFNLPLQVESIFTRSRKLATIQKGTTPYVREKEKEDPNVKFFTEQEQRMGLFKTGEVEYNGKTLDKYMRTQSVLPQADLLKIVELFKLDLDALGVNPIVGLLARLDKNLNYFGGQVERFTGEIGKFLEYPITKKGIEVLKIIPFLNEINKLIGGSYVDEDKPPIAIRLEQVISPLGVTLKDPEQVKYFGILADEAELKGSFEAGLESLYVRYLAESRLHPGEVQFKQNVEKLEKLLLQKGLTGLSLVPLKIKATKKFLQTQLQEKIKYGEIDKKKDSILTEEIKKYFEPAPNLRFRDITREVYELLMPDIAQTPDEAKRMNYKKLNIISEERMQELGMSEKEIKREYGLYSSPEGFLVMIGPEGSKAVDPFVGMAAMRTVGRIAVKQVERSVFSGFKDITTNILNQLKGRYRVSKQFIADLAKRPEVKKAERDIVEAVLKDMTGESLPIKIQGYNMIPVENAYKVEDNFYYHVTERANLSSIKTSGLKKQINKYGYEQTKPGVFISESIDEAQIFAYEGGLKDGVVLRIPKTQLDKTKLVADEAMEEFSEGFSYLYKDNIKATDSFEIVADEISKPIRINVQEFADRVKSELLPLQEGLSTKWIPDEYRYEKIALPDELRGNIAKYTERIYESPIKTSAGGLHFDSEIKNYFAHTRIEDIASIEKIGKDLIDSGVSQKGGTRRVIEIQSDLFQKGNLERSVGIPGEMQVLNNLEKLQPYRNTWHERIIKEEIKKASQDGKSVLQFPTGETAMKIEGLGERNNIWREAINGSYSGNILSLERLKVGKTINNASANVVGGQGDWIITDILGDGKFKAVPKRIFDEDGYLGKVLSTEEKIKRFNLPENINRTEQFDISGKVDTSNPIYKFYEDTVQKYLKKIRPATIGDEVYRFTHPKRSAPQKAPTKWYTTEKTTQELDKSLSSELVGEYTEYTTAKAIRTTASLDLTKPYIQENAMLWKGSASILKDPKPDGFDATLWNKLKKIRKELDTGGMEGEDEAFDLMHSLTGKYNLPEEIRGMGDASVMDYLLSRELKNIGYDSLILKAKTGVEHTLTFTDQVKSTGMKRITDPQGIEWFEIPITKQDAISPIDAFSVAALPASLLGLEATDKDDAETKEPTERRELKPGETMFDTKTGIEFYRPKEGEVEIKELEEKGKVEVGTEEEFKKEDEEKYSIESTEEVVKRLSTWTTGEASHYDPLDPTQTRSATTGVGAYGRKVERGSIAFGNRYFQQQLKAGAMIYIKVKELENVKTPYGNGVFRVDDTMNRRYSQRWQFNIDFHQEDLNEANLKRGRFPIQFKIIGYSSSSS